MPSSSIRYMFSAVLFLVATTPIFSMIEFRDTTQLPQCDTIIDKDGKAYPVKLLSVSSKIIQYTLCNKISKKIISVSTDDIQGIKSETFSLVKRAPKSILTRAKTAFKVVGFSLLAFFLSILALIPAFNGAENTSDLLFIPFIVILISPFLILGGFFACIDILYKAKKEGDKKAQGLARTGIAIVLVPILLILAIRFL